MWFSGPGRKPGILALPLLVTALACGPSAQLLYEGNVRFEHCHRLDFDQRIAPSHRKTCWQEWVSTYSRGQTRDRIEYARRRIAALEAGQTMPLSLNLEGSDEVTPAPTESPVPTSLHAPPPRVAPVPVAASASTVADAGLDSSDSLADEVALPRQGCLDGCARTYLSCARECAADAGEAGAECPDCERGYLACGRRCFR